MSLKRALLVLLAIAAVLAANFMPSGKTKAEPQGVNWFAPVTPIVTKTHDNPDNSSPSSSNYDCYHITIVSVDNCAMDTNIGTVLTNGKIKEGDNAYTLNGYNGFGSIIPVPNSPMFLTTQPGAVTGEYVAVHRTLERKDLSQVLGSGLPPRKSYQVTKQFDFWLADEANKKIQVNTDAMAFSQNGAWLVFDVPRVGLYRMNMATMDLVPFGPSIEQSWYTSTYSASIAITNDGRFAAMANGAELKLYDIASCTQSGYQNAPSFAGCQYRDMWSGQQAQGKGTGDLGLQSVIPNGAVTGNLRFINDGNISFDARYNYVAWNDYKSASYVVTASGVGLHKLGLLGIGDSYISGEGEFDYEDGTDDLDLNMCHLSRKSYPFLLGDQYFNSKQSVACSGAKMVDIGGATNNKDYNGEYGSFSKLAQSQSSLLGAFSPGYLHQNDFNQEYSPEATLVSIGGNDVHFSDIVKNCVMGTDNGGTCYATYEDRYELMQTIDNAFDSLVNTYTAMKNASPTTRVYVVGYPQIVKPDSDTCGLNVVMNSEERKFAPQLVSYLDGTIKKAAAKAGVYYVDTEHAFDGYRLCEGRDDQIAMNGLTAGKDVPVLKGKWLRLIGKESYHPTVLGHELLAETIAEKTHGLSAKMPDAQKDLNKPVIVGDEPLLVSAPKDNRKIYRLEGDENIMADLIDKGVATTIDINGLIHDTALNAAFGAVLHSDPINLGTLHSDSNGDIHGQVMIPASVPVGLHTIHVYGKNMAGQDIDIQKIVYITNNSATEFNGQCAFVLDSGIDYDKDGTDDVCDPVIGNAPPTMPNGNADTSAQSQNSTDMNDKDVTSVSNVLQGSIDSISLAATSKKISITVTPFSDTRTVTAQLTSDDASTESVSSPQVLGIANTNTHSTNKHVEEPSARTASYGRSWVAALLLALGVVGVLARLTMRLRLK